MAPQGKTKKCLSKPDVVNNSATLTNGTADNVHNLYWEWEDDGSKWTAYSSKQSKALNVAYEKGQKEVTLTAENKTKFMVKFEKMVQKHKGTGWERRIRCVLKSKDGDLYSWQWQDERKQWNCYDAPDSIQLEQCLLAGGGDASTVVLGNGCTVDVKSMQHCDSEATYKVQRVKSSAPAHTASTPAPVTPIPAGAVVRKSERAKKKKKTYNDDNDADAEADDDEVPVKKAKSRKKQETQVADSDEDVSVKKQKLSKKQKAVDSKEDIEANVRTVIVSGKAPVDPECVEKLGKAHVYYENNDIYDAMLNQTNLQWNNNKYYILQLLEDDNSKSYNVWFRWGRVGKKGQNSLIPCGPDMEKAKSVFKNKFKDKTKNDWNMRNAFVKVPGKYDLLQMDYSVDKSDEVQEKTEVKPNKEIKEEPKSKLDDNVQSLIQLICDIKAMEDAVMEMKYDCKKAPLGKLTTEQIRAGYAALKKIASLVDSGQTTGSALIQACNDFYTRVPHDFGMKQPPLIRKTDEVKAKLNLLEALGDIEVAIRTLKESTEVNVHPIDRNYHSLKCELQTLTHGCDIFQVIEKYVKNTHAATHNMYQLKIEDVFVVEKDGEADAFRDVGNKMLLWHGSRITNWAGILSRGLRIAPPEAPVTGYMFGKGVYFADICSKSANYCFASRSLNTGILVLCEVALGVCNELLAADYSADKLPTGKHSVKGLGRVAPDPNDTHTLASGAVVPYGIPVETGVKNPSGYTLSYNEFIVYDRAQVRMRYLVKLSFNFN